jgi:hypothetical protein
MTDSAKQDAAPSAEAGHADTEEAGSERAATAEAHAGGDGDQAKPDIDEVKRKFREALDRKRDAHAEGSGKGANESGKIHGAHGKEGGRRQFRRKSG